MARSPVPSRLESPKQAGSFISYSRKDATLVRRLDDALRARGRDPWVDWDDIPPSAEWMDSIRAGIDAAPAVIFVLSPDALSSGVCAQEIAYALAQNKRLIPLVCRPVHPGEVGDEVRRLNWMTLTDVDAIDAHIDALMTALDTDLQWAQMHARLLVRAREWDGADHDTSRLLRGTELRAAERQLADIDVAQTPQPTPLQKQYVLASRQAQTRRQRIAIASIAAALVVTVVLAIVSIVQTRNAEHQRGIAVARLLAAQALKQVTEATGRSDVALLLAATATAIDPSPEAQESLWQALVSTRHARKFVHTGATLVSLAASPDGRVVATGSFSGEVKLWDAQTLRLLASRKAGNGAAEALAFNPDGTRLAIGTAGAVALLDPRTAQVLRVLGTGGQERITRLAWSTDGMTLFAASTNEAVIRSWDVASGNQGTPIPAHQRGVRALAISPDGRTLASAGNDDQVVRLWDIAHRTERLRLQAHAAGVRSLAFSRDGATVASGHADSTIAVHDAASGALVHSLHGQAGSIDSIVFGAGAHRLVSGSNNRTVFLWDLHSPARPTLLAGHGNGVLALAMSPDGQLLYSVAFEPSLIAWSVELTPFQTALPVHRGDVRALAVSGDGQWIASGGDDGTVRLWRSDGHAAGASEAMAVKGRSGDAEPARLEGHHGPVRTLAFSADAALLVSGSEGDHRAIVWDVASGRQRSAMDTGHDVTALAISADAGVLATGGEDGGAIQLWSLATGQRRGELAGHDGHVTALAFGADGRTLFSGGSDQAIRRWDWAGSGQEIADPLGAGGTVTGLASGSAGALLASAAHWPGGVLLHDLRREGTARELPTRSPSGGHSVAFSPDGTTLAYSADELGTTIVLWDIRQAGPRVELTAMSTAMSLAFTSGGKLLASGHHDGRVVLWDVDFAQWPQRACAIANRNLTLEEWQAAVGSLPYRAACPGLPVPGAGSG